VSGYSQIKSKVEAAFDAVIGTRAEGTDLADVTRYRRFAGSDISGKRIEIVCEEATPEMFGDAYTGNWHCQVSVAYYDHVDSGHTDRTAIEDLLFDILMDTNLVDALNAAGVDEFHVYGGSAGEGAGAGWEPGPIRSEVGTGGVFREIMTGTLYCRPSAVQEEGD
jgi:hypothetical protein